MPITPIPIIIPQVHHSGCCNFVFIDNIHLFLFVAHMACVGFTLFSIALFFAASELDFIFKNARKIEGNCARMIYISFAMTLLFFISFVIYGHC